MSCSKNSSEKHTVINGISVTEITDFDSPLLDPYARLTEHQLRDRRHRENGVFVAESEKVIRLALDAGYSPVSVLAQKKLLSGKEAKTIKRCDGVPVMTAEDEILEKLTGFSFSLGLLAVFRRPSLPSVSEICANASRIAVLEGIADSTNVGALFRSAAALGMDAVLTTPSCADPLLRRAVRVSMGTVFQIPFTQIERNPLSPSGWDTDILKKEGFVLAAMALKDDTVPVYDERLKKAGKLAVILGSEGYGLCDETVKGSDFTVKIPMYHGVDSLNVAAAGALAFWETMPRSGK